MTYADILVKIRLKLKFMCKRNQAKRVVYSCSFVVLPQRRSQNVIFSLDP